MKGTYFHFTIDLLTFPTLILKVEISFHIHQDLSFDTIGLSVRLTDRFIFDILLVSKKVNNQRAHALQHSLELVGCLRMASQDRADETPIQSIGRSPNCSQSSDRLPHSITAPFPSINTDQQHVQTTWHQLSIKDRVTLSNKLVSASPAVRRSFNDILGQLGLDDLDVLREWFITCHPHHFSVAIEI